MPLSKYYGGHGAQVMTAMTEQYGAKKGKAVFYATANKQKKAKSRRAVPRKSLASGG